MQPQRRYCCVGPGYHSAVTGVAVTTQADGTDPSGSFVIWFLEVSCFLSALHTEQNSKFFQPWMRLQQLQPLHPT